MSHDIDAYVDFIRAEAKRIWIRKSLPAKLFDRALKRGIRGRKGGLMGIAEFGGYRSGAEFIFQDGKIRRIEVTIKTASSPRFGPGFDSAFRRAHWAITDFAGPSVKGEPSMNRLEWTYRDVPIRLFGRASEGPRHVVMAIGYADGELATHRANLADLFEYSS